MEQKNVFLAIILSILVLVGFQYFAPPPPTPAPQQENAQNTDGDLPQPTAGKAGTVAVEEPDFEVVLPRGDILEQTDRVKISSGVLK